MQTKLQDNKSYREYKTPKYLKGYANKIIKDLTKHLRLYSGKCAVLYQRDKNGVRCSYCTDKDTGARLVTDCPQCDGSGYVVGYEKIGEFSIMLEYTPENNIPTPLGNQEIKKDQLVLVGAPEVKDQDLLIMKDTKDVYKIVNVDAYNVALNGIVISQLVTTSRIPVGEKEYDLIDW